MGDKNKHRQSRAQLLAENEQLRLRLEEAEQTLEAIRHGDIDALVVVGPPGEQIYTLTGAEHVYRVIVETMNEAGLTVAPDGTILFCNQRFCDLMKTSLDEVLGRKVTAFVARPQQLPLKALLKDAQAGPVQRRLTLQAADGTIVPVQLSASLLRTDEGTSVCLVASDLTELEASANSVRVLREHQQALEASEARFRAIFESTQDAVVIANDKGVCVQANPAVQTVFGLPPEQLIGRPMAEFVGKQTDFRALWQTFLAAGIYRGEMPLIAADGQVRYVEAYSVAGILPGRHLSVLRDMTERKQAREALLAVNEELQQQAEELQTQAEELRVQTEELRVTNDEIAAREEELRIANEALRGSEQRLRRFYESGLVGVMYWNINGAVTDGNDKFLEMLGYTRRELRAGQINWVQITPPEYRPLDEQSIAELKAAGVNSKPFEKEYRRKDGTRVPIIIAGAMLDEERVNGVAFVLDITDRKRGEEALRESEERYHHLFEDDLTGDFISTPEGEILLCNPAFARMFGFSSPQEAVGTSMLDLWLDPSERKRRVERLRQEGKLERLEVWRKRRDGAPIYVVENLVGHFNERGELYEIKGYLFDDTERKRAEEALRELTKTLETRVAQRTAELQYRARQLQRLTLELSEAEDRERKRLAEILHDDLQQQLAAAKFHLGLLQSRAKRDPAQQAVIAQVDHLLDDAVQKSRSLSHELSPAVLYHSGLAAALNWLAEQIRTKHGLVVTVTASGEVNTHSEALKTFLYKAAQELLFNVVKHARVAEARIHLRRWRHCLCLAVSDRGRGFDPQRLRETPGFGLLSIRERVELLGGRMSIHSAPDHGATFRIVVPDGVVIPGAGPKELGVVPLPSAVAGPLPPAEPRLRVLLADDHDIVREGLASLLSEERDLQVVGEAANGREVIDLADALHPDVIIMDVAMPLIDGDEATRQIKLHLPRTRVIALSMYEEAHMVERMYRAGAENYILKTAPSRELLAAIRGQGLNV